MSEPRLGAELVTGFSRILRGAIVSYALVVIGVYVGVGELQLRRSLERSADVIQSLLGLYADPEGTPTTVAPEMLADQLIGMDQQFAITRTVQSDEMRSVYFLSPTMPAKRLESLAPSASAEEIRMLVLDAIADRARWRFRVLHRPAGDFDVYVVASRTLFLVGLIALVAAGVVLLPVAIVLAKGRAQRSVNKTLAPLHDVTSTTSAIGPDDLGQRLATPTGQADLTQLAESINRMLERVERAQDALKSFTADASHELRTPLTHLRVQTQWAQAEERTEEETREALVAIEREIDRTTKMVEDLLLIARGENGQLALERADFDLTDVTREVIEVAEAMGATRGLNIATKLNGPVRAMGDPERTRHVLLNLVSNAVRYTADGRVTISLRRSDDMVGVEVQDTGPGISTEHCDKIFDRFYRVEGSRSRSHGGAGLGLTIARLLAELQGGRITVQSETGVGSTFTLWLPVPS